MQLHPCECGESEFEWAERGLVQRDERWVSVYSGECERCGRPRVFEFALVPEPAPPAPALGGDAPSHIIDPGEFLQTSEELADSVPDDPASLGDDEFHAARDALAYALASVEEVLKFIPAGAEAVPAAAFRSPAGRRLHAMAPERFSRRHLEATRAGYQRLLAGYAAAAHPTRPVPAA